MHLSCCIVHTSHSCHIRVQGCVKQVKFVQVYLCVSLNLSKTFIICLGSWWYWVLTIYIFNFREHSRWICRCHMTVLLISIGGLGLRLKKMYTVDFRGIQAVQAHFLFFFFFKFHFLELCDKFVPCLLVFYVMNYEFSHKILLYGEDICVIYCLANFLFFLICKQSM